MDCEQVWNVCSYCAVRRSLFAADFDLRVLRIIDEFCELLYRFLGSPVSALCRAFREFVSMDLGCLVVDVSLPGLLDDLSCGLPNLVCCNLCASLSCCFFMNLST